MHTILSGKSQGENGQGANEGGTFKTWLSSHGGAVQPNISGEYAHYQFTITPVQLESALMRLAQQLAAPEIDAQVLERSRGAVRAAYQSAAEDPEHRLRSEEHTSELQSRGHLVCRLLLEKRKKK